MVLALRRGRNARHSLPLLVQSVIPQSYAPSLPHNLPAQTVRLTIMIFSVFGASSLMFNDMSSKDKLLAISKLVFSLEFPGIIHNHLGRRVFEVFIRKLISKFTQILLVYRIENDKFYP